ncbi:hypothetical protein CCAX7_28470 [Capsulimonas corticalis]|uniref:Uncharacterized protein n=1 Tax=Capsulimonas corticalis TaxID=2219043 RepID=A0A402CT97_9BACT|nr:AAA family ATPase [Capsulimonas corticalis]BDI30796.1 hypothetical protein CCAX7_28470 [Capsulimonas corticalis]
MYISIDQIQSSLSNLADVHPFFGMSFLAFKASRLPIGRSADIVFTRIADDILKKHYKIPNQPGYYNPFRSSTPDQRWVVPRYGSTSLQRITTDTFGDVFIHEKKSSQWGWNDNYVNILQKHLNGHLIPTFDLAVWLYRSENFGSSLSPNELITRFIDDYLISDIELDLLFDLETIKVCEKFTSDDPIPTSELLTILTRQQNAPLDEGATLKYLELKNIGPAEEMHYEPGDRLNIITGDNSLGKTFLFECAWWALTGSWSSHQVIPRLEAPDEIAPINAGITRPKDGIDHITGFYNRKNQQWRLKDKRSVMPGLIIYAKADGSYAVWDPARAKLSINTTITQSTIVMSSSEVFDGVREQGNQGTFQWICNGLIRDWVTWKNDSRYIDRYEAFIQCLADLTPSSSEPMKPGNFTRIPNDSRDIPCLRMPYGDIPILYASAGVQRIVALAYVIVWSWFEHQERSSILQTSIQDHIVLMIDEIEAHLHPRWQRVIVPAIINVMETLAPTVQIQSHISTHSPMVMVSVEPMFDNHIDRLYHLRSESRGAVLEELPFIKRGRADLWLISEVFGLNQARSVPAEQAIAEATRILLVDSPSHQEVLFINSQLVNLLAPDDEFWPQWRYFAKQNGVKN